MTLPVFPSQIYGLKPSLIKTPEFSTVVQSGDSGGVTTIPQMLNPLWHFNLIFEQLFNDDRNPAYPGSSELETLLALFLAMSGGNGVFLLDDPEDDTAFEVPLPLVTDGAGNWYSPLQRTIGNSAVALFSEDITDLNPQDGSGLQVWANAVPQTLGSTCSGSVNAVLSGPGLAVPGASYSGLYLKWCAPPTAPITASFQWFFRVRFEEDKVDFEKFLYRLWTIGGTEGQRGSGMLKLVTRRPPGY